MRSTASRLLLSNCRIGEASQAQWGFLCHLRGANQQKCPSLEYVSRGGGGGIRREGSLWDGAWGCLGWLSLAWLYRLPLPIWWVRNLTGPLQMAASCPACVLNSQTFFCVVRYGNLRDFAKRCLGLGFLSIWAHRWCLLIWRWGEDLWTTGSSSRE